MTTVHRIWLGPRPMPDRYRAYGQRWEQLHPDWEVHDWTQDELEQLPMVNRAVWEALADGANSGVPMPAEQAIAVQRADVAAYELMRLFGGVYVNCDIEPLRPLGPLLAQHPGRCIVGHEDQRFLCNAVMIGPANAPLWNTITLRLGPRFTQRRWHMMNQVTGPWLLTEVVAENPGLAVQLPVTAFYPVHYTAIPSGQHAPAGDYPSSWTLHHWGHRLSAS